MEKVYIIAKKVYIRGYETAKKLFFHSKKIYISDEKVYNIYQNMPKSSYEVNQCEPRSTLLKVYIHLPPDEDILNNNVFGLVQVDIETPEDL